MAIVLENLVIPTFILAIIYFLLTVYGFRKLLSLHNGVSQINTRKLFVMSCLLSSMIRFLSFSSMSALNYFKFNVKIDTSGSTDDSRGISEFYEKASLVLFDLPDFNIMSAYVLLLVVWAEAILQSRRHWLSTASFRRRWILLYVVFNMILYTVQVSLYSFLFVPAVDQTILSSIIYLTLTVINLVVPLLWLCSYIYLAIVFSGFPYSSAVSRRRLSSLTYLGGFWTFTRLVWGFSALTSVMKGWLFSDDNQTVEYAVVLVSIFMLTEVIPIVYSFQSSILSSLGEAAKAQAVSETVKNPLHDPVANNDLSNPLLNGATSFADLHNEATEEPPGDGTIPIAAVSQYFASSPNFRSQTWGDDDDEEQVVGEYGEVRPPRESEGSVYSEWAGDSVEDRDSMARKKADTWSNVWGGWGLGF